MWETKTEFKVMETKVDKIRHDTNISKISLPYSEEEVFKSL